MDGLDTNPLTKKSEHFYGKTSKKMPFLKEFLKDLTTTIFWLKNGLKSVPIFGAMSLHGLWELENDIWHEYSMGVDLSEKTIGAWGAPKRHI